MGTAEAQLGSQGLSRWQLYRSLAEPVRLQLLALVAREEFTVGELGVLANQPQPKVSRHVSALRMQGLVRIRKEGTRAWASLAPGVKDDPVVFDALAAGRLLCEGDGSFDRIGQVHRQREQEGRDFFKTPLRHGSVVLPEALRVYLMALSPLLGKADLAVDVGTGDGEFVDILAPLFRRVIAIDREAAQLERLRQRLLAHGLDQVELWEGEFSDALLVARIQQAGGADAVCAARMLHHAAQPAKAMAAFAAMARPAGRVVVLDYQAHQTEELRGQGDVWLGFEPAELRRLAESAGLKEIDVLPIRAPLGLDGADAQLPWQILIGTKE